MARVSKKELDGAISKTKAKNIKMAAGQMELPKKSVLYDKAGNQCNVLPEDQIMAHYSSHTNQITYKVRINRRNELFNPFDKSYADESRRIAQVEGTTPYVMLDTTKKIFEAYVQFLKSKNTDYLLIAQREI